MKTIVFFLEEPSAKEMLKGILPRFLPSEFNTRYVVFQGKQDMEKQLERRLRGWLLPDSLFVILRDQDSANCQDVKAGLVELCVKSGKGEALVRIACKELESFYLGDLEAVERGLELRGIADKQGKRKFRSPDDLGNPYMELSALTGNLYQKVSGSRSIGPHLNLDGNRSRSFCALVAGIKKLAECP
ncbi:MAG: DUF4276 family protein [Syntrophobacteraceae bacterium]